MKNSEQPEDLFDWAQSHQINQQSEQPAPSFTKARPDDGLGWDCTQCELNNGWCGGHPRRFEPIDFTQSQSSLTQEEKDALDRLDRIVDKEADIAEQEADSKRPLTPEEAHQMMEDLKEQLKKIA